MLRRSFAVRPPHSTPRIAEGKAPVGAPDSLGAYKLLALLGSGGMASVYLAKRRDLADSDATFAVKLTHTHLRDDEALADATLLEANIAARIRHRNVVRVHEVGEAPAGLYLVMDYIEGDTVAGLVRAAGERGERLPLPIAAAIVSDALAGLHAAHELRGDDGAALEVIHRDFSPQNILIGIDGITRLTDFGVAKLASHVTRNGLVSGKLPYMSPEQLRGERLDRRTDIWAAGVVLWEVLAGEALFSRTSEPVTLRHILEGTIRSITDLRSDIPPALAATLERALSRDPRRRFDDAAKMRRALRAAVRIATPYQVAAYLARRLAPKLTSRRALLEKTWNHERLPELDPPLLSPGPELESPEAPRPPPAPPPSSPEAVVPGRDPGAVARSRASAPCKQLATSTLVFAAVGIIALALGLRGMGVRASSLAFARGAASSAPQCTQPDTLPPASSESTLLATSKVSGTSSGATAPLIP